MGAETVEPSAAVAVEATVMVMARPLCSARRRRAAHGLESVMSATSQPYWTASAALTATKSKSAHVTSSVISFSTTSTSCVVVEPPTSMGTGLAPPYSSSCSLPGQKKPEAGHTSGVALPTGAQ